jgi:hypothetical protein
MKLQHEMLYCGSRLEAAHYLWLRRDIRIPATWTGRRFVLDLRGAKYNPHAYVDEKLAGTSSMASSL